MSAYGKVAAILGDYRYSVSPELAISESISGVAVLKESFAVGQQVKIIQIGDGETSAAEFGFASVAANLKPVIAVADSVKPAVIDASPASFMAAYIASAANKFTRLYELATVISSGASSLVVKYITGRLAGSQRSIRCIDVSPASFIAGEIALIDSWQYGYDVVVGWWDIQIRGFLFLGASPKGYIYSIAGESLQTLPNYGNTSRVGQGIKAGDSVYFPMIYDGFYEIDLVFAEYNLNTEDWVMRSGPTYAGGAVGGRGFSGCYAHNNNLIAIPWPDTPIFSIMNLTTKDIAWGPDSLGHYFYCKVPQSVVGSNLYLCGAAKIVIYNLESNTISEGCSLPNTGAPGFPETVFSSPVIVSSALMILPPVTDSYPKIGRYNPENNTYSEGPEITIPDGANNPFYCFAYGTDVFFISGLGFIGVYDTVTNTMSEDAIDLTPAAQVMTSVRGATKIGDTQVLIYGSYGFASLDMANKTLSLKDNLNTVTANSPICGVYYV